MMRLGASAEDLVEAVADDALRGDEAGALDVGAVGQQHQNAVLADARQPGDVEQLAIYGRLVELEVARVDQRSGGGVQGEADGIGDGVRDPERLHVEQADLEPIRRVERDELRLVQHLVFRQLAFREADGQAGAVDGDVELLQDPAQRADVVLVAVRQDDALHHLLVFQQVGDVGDDEVHAELVGAGEGEAAVNDDDLVLTADRRHVLADLADPAERDDLEGVFVGHKSIRRNARQLYN